MKFKNVNPKLELDEKGEGFKINWAKLVAWLTALLFIFFVAFKIYGTYQKLMLVQDELRFAWENPEIVRSVRDFYEKNEKQIKIDVSEKLGKKDVIELEIEEGKKE